MNILKPTNRFLFSLNTPPSSKERELAEKAGVELIHVRYIEPFDGHMPAKLHALANEHGANGIVCFHPLVAVTAINATGLALGSFRQSETDIDGEPDLFTVTRNVVIDGTIHLQCDAVLDDGAPPPAGSVRYQGAK